MAVLRPAGLNELRCIARDDLKLYGSIVTLGLYSGPRTLQLDDLIKLLKRCIATHPVLAVSIQGADTENPQLVQADELDLNAHIQVLEPSSPDDESLQALLESIHNEPLPDPRIRPQWRIVVQPIHGENSHHFRLALACSHSLVDGRSGYAFHTTFLKSLEGLQQLTEDATPMWRPTARRAVLPSLEAAGELPISWGFLLGPLVQVYLPKFVGRWIGVEATSKEGVWLGAAARPLRTHSDPCTRVVIVSVPSDVVERVATICRQKNARITGLLNHVVARCLYRALTKRQQPLSRFICETPIDMRRCRQQGEGEMVNYVSATTETINIELPEGLVDWAAVRVSTEMLRAKAESSRDQPIGLLKYLNDFRGWTLKKASSPPEVSFSVSNLGVFTETTSVWKMEAMTFSQSGNGTGEPLSVSVASVKGGSLALAMTWWPGMLGVADEETFVLEVGNDIGAEMKNIS